MFQGVDPRSAAQDRRWRRDVSGGHVILSVPMRCATSILLCLLALTAAPAGALGSSGDVAATRAYARANYALVRAARANLAVGQAAIKGLARQLASECPLVAAESPQDHDSEQLSNEVAGALTVAAYHPDAGAAVAFAHAVQGLHWSDPRLTHVVRTYAARLVALTALAMPNVCADVKAWVASNYQTLPPSSLEFDKLYYADDIEAEEVPMRLLARYGSASTASLLHRAKRLEAPLAEAEADAVADYTHILDALKLSQ
jgi:hypothetical protein